MEKKCCSSCEKGERCEETKFKAMTKHTGNRMYSAMTAPSPGNAFLFPSSQTAMKSFPIFKKNSFQMKSSNFGFSFLQFNFGQYLSSDAFVETTANTDVGRSNLFVAEGLQSDFTSITDRTKKGHSTHLVAKKSLITENKYFNAIRPGPCKIRYDYTGTLDQSSGTVYIGISYSFSSVSDVTSSGLLPDIDYMGLKPVEDCKPSRSFPANRSFEVIYVPHDYNQLNFYNPSQGMTGLVQRLNIFVSGAEADKNFARIEITEIHEGVPNTSLSEIALSVGNNIITVDEYYDAVRVIENEGIIRKVESEYDLLSRY
jgi:hypothetical protein